jgi:hypothetical protein
MRCVSGSKVSVKPTALGAGAGAFAAAAAGAGVGSGVCRSVLGVRTRGAIDDVSIKAMIDLPEPRSRQKSDEN